MCVGGQNRGGMPAKVTPVPRVVAARRIEEIKTVIKTGGIGGEERLDLESELDSLVNTPCLETPVLHADVLVLVFGHLIASSGKEWSTAIERVSRLWKAIVFDRFYDAYLEGSLERVLGRHLIAQKIDGDPFSYCMWHQSTGRGTESVVNEYRILDRRYLTRSTNGEEKERVDLFPLLEMTKTSEEDTPYEVFSCGMDLVVLMNTRIIRFCSATLRLKALMPVYGNKLTYRMERSAEVLVYDQLSRRVGIAYPKDGTVSQTNVTIEPFADLPLEIGRKNYRELYIAFARDGTRGLALNQCGSDIVIDLPENALPNAPYVYKHYSMGRIGRDMVFVTPNYVYVWRDEQGGGVKRLLIPLKPGNPSIVLVHVHQGIRIGDMWYTTGGNRRRKVHVG